MVAKTFRKRAPKRAVGVRRKTMRKRASTSTVAMAKKALRIAKRLQGSVEETKYLSYNDNLDLVNNGSGTWGAAVFRQITSTAGTTPLFNSDPITGNKAYLKGAKLTWEVHMDSANNEEETCNFTVAVVKAKSEADSVFAIGTAGQHVSTIQGQTYFDPRYFKILYYKHFTRTMGGTSPGTSGEMLRWGSCYIPMNKLVRLTQEGNPGAQTSSAPSSFQDQYFFLVFTDNTSGDLESPRINYRTMLIAKDVDANT